MAATVNLNFDNFVRRSPKHLPKYQIRDRIIREILQILKQNQEKSLKNFDNFVRRSPKHLPNYQIRDRIIHEILQILKQNQQKSLKNFMVQNDPLHSKDSQNYPYWKSVLPIDLDIPVICSYMSRTSGHRNSYLRLPDFLSKKPLSEGQKFISLCDTCHKVSIQTGVTQPRINP